MLNVWPDEPVGLASVIKSDALICLTAYSQTASAAIGMHNIAKHVLMFAMNIAGIRLALEIYPLRAYKFCHFTLEGFYFLRVMPRCRISIAIEIL